MHPVDKQDEALAAAVRAKIAEARSDLARRMAEAGLRERDGWRVAEELRSLPSGTQFVFRPIHTRLDAPDIEATVSIDTDGFPL